MRYRTPYAKIISIFDRLTSENLCAKVITKQFCNPSGILVLDPELLTSIRHKNIIEYRDIYESEEELIVTIERYWLCNRYHSRAFGGELLDRIVEKNTYTEVDASHIIKQILEAVSYLHSKGIVIMFVIESSHRFIVISSQKIFFFQREVMYGLFSFIHMVGYIHQVERFWFIQTNRRSR